jgi:cyanophycinase-like exopeptidase
MIGAVPQTPRPIYLLADSQLLFWKDGDARFLESVLEPARAPRAAYIGASNGDVPEFYDIFRAAMHAVGIRDCRMIRSAFPSEDETFLNDADVILLAGGDAAAGWRIISRTGMKDAVIARYHAGATLLGVSAGAVQLGMHAISQQADGLGTLLDTFQICPFIVGAHDERNEWRDLHHTVHLLEGRVQGIGIATGAGVVYHPDQSIEAIRHAFHHVHFMGGVVRRELVLARTRIA